jgi:hypothetical protein
MPLCDNFWQSQALVMLTPRLPLYIPCVCFCMIYCATVTASKLNLPLAAECAAAGVLGVVFYTPYGPSVSLNHP